LYIVVNTDTLLLLLQYDDGSDDVDDDDDNDCVNSTSLLCKYYELHSETPVL